MMEDEGTEQWKTKVRMMEDEGTEQWKTKVLNDGGRGY